jgi:predicted RNA-binding Zn-ribbon protein involved in translation (DUF1610 family)
MKKNNDLAKEMCQECGKTFLGGKNAFICPDCRKIRLSEAAKKRQLSKLGNEARRKDRKEMQDESETNRPI